MKPKSILASTAVLAAACAVATSTAMGASASAATTASNQHHPAAARVLTVGLKSIKVKKYGSVLADRGGYTLYLLSTEANKKIHCTSYCLQYWPPLLISKGEKVSIGAGVKGKVGTVARSSKSLQVTFNGYPVYTFAGDSGPGETNGEKIASFGGTWYMLRPTAKTAAATPVK